MSQTTQGRSLVIIPTYNESENIADVTSQSVGVDPSIDLLFVDDNSTDGTQDRIAEAQTRFPNRIHLVRRSGKLGLGTAYIAGFKWALERAYERVIEMDADLSHDPKDLGRMLGLLHRYPVVVGSRYVAGGRTENWGLLRQLISRSGSLYSRLMLGFRVKDMTAGYVGWNRQVLETIRLDKVKSQGYGFQVELKYRAHRAGFAIHEMPIVFRDRIRGTSKMGAHIVLEAIQRVFLLRIAALRDPNF
jgi:dolichol-phosphate mannosyltransferase